MVERVLLRLILFVYISDEGAVRAVGSISDDVEAWFVETGNEDRDADEVELGEVMGTWIDFG